MCSVLTDVGMGEGMVQQDTGNAPVRPDAIVINPMNLSRRGSLLRHGVTLLVMP